MVKLDVIQELRGSVSDGKVTVVDMPSFYRDHRILKQLHNSLDDIQNHVLRPGNISVYPLSVIADGHDSLKNLQQWCKKLSGEGLAYVTLSLPVSVNIQQQLFDFKDFKYDIFLLLKGMPGIVLTVVNDGAKTTDAGKYNSTVAKEMVSSLRKFTIERVSCAFGVVENSCLSDADVFKETINKILRESTVFASPDSLTMSDVKYRAVAKAFLAAVASTACVRREDSEENTEWFLTLDQFRLLTENIDRPEKEITINIYPDSGGKVLLLEVARRLEKYGDTLLISEREDILSNANDLKVCSETVSLGNIHERHHRFNNIVLYCNSNSIPNDFLDASNYQRLWLFHPVKVPQMIPASPDELCKSLPTGLPIGFEQKATFSRSVARTMSAKMLPIPGEEALLFEQSPIRNIIDSTKHLIEHQAATKHISTYAERSAFKILKRCGFVLIKGRSGSGKSSLGRSLLSQIERELRGIPILINFPHQWDWIPIHQIGCEKFVIMIDDIFGTSTFVQSLFDEWRKMFDIIWPLVDCGHIYLIMTTRPEINKHCEKSLKRYQLFENIEHISLDEGEYALRKCEKEKLLKQYCGKAMSITPEQMEEIIAAKTILGFPQCCQFFANSRDAQKMGVKFFTSTYKHLVSEITHLSEVDPLGYLVLLLVMRMKGCLGRAHLNPLDTSVHFRILVATLRQFVSLSLPPSKEQIRAKADSLCGVYLSSTEIGYKFQHQSVFDSVFLSISQDHPDACIDICSSDMLIKFVRTQTTQKKDHEVTLYLQRKHYYLLAARITDLLLDDFVDILDHPCFKNAAFVKSLIDYWKQNRLQNVLMKTYPETSKHVMKALPFEYKSFLSYVILKGIVSIPERLLLSEDPIIIQACWTLPLREILACAIYVFQSDLINVLLTRVVPDENCLWAFCAAPNISEDYTTKIFGVTEKHLKQVVDHEDLLYLNVTQGKYLAVNLMMKALAKLQIDKRIYSQCLVQLFEKLSNSDREKDQPDMDMIKIIEMLFNTECHVDLNSLLWKAATLRNARALKLVLQKNVDVNKPCCGLYPIHQACKLGGSDCLLQLLQSGADMYVNAQHQGKEHDKAFSTLYLASKSVYESKKKIEHLLKYHTKQKRKGKKEQKIDHERQYVNTSCQSGLSPLHGAAKPGNSDSLKVLLQKGAHVNVTNEDGNTPLHVAAKYNRKDCVSLLVAAKAEINIKNTFGSTPLHYAGERANRDVAELLIKAGAEINLTDQENRTCLHRTIGCGNSEIIELLIKSGSSINIPDKGGETALHKALRVEEVSTLKMLSQHNAKLDQSDACGESVVHKAAGSDVDALEKLQFLSSKGVNIHVVDKKGRSALFNAVQAGDTEVVEFFQDNGLKLTTCDKEGNTQLHAACEVSGNNKTMVEYLLDKGLDATAKGTEGNTPLLLNLQNQTMVVTKLIQKRTVNICNNRKLGALHFAAETGKTDILKLLLCSGADPNVSNNTGKTPLHILLERERKRTDIIDLLLGKRADPSKQDYKGKTAIHVATKLADVKTLELLMINCEKPWTCDELGRTPLHLAARRGITDIAKCLIKHGAELNVKDHSERTPLYYSVDKERLEMTRLLLKSGAHASIEDIKGRIPLHIATIRQNVTIVKLLLSNDSGADINPQDKKGKTPIHLAVMRKSNAMVVTLLRCGADPSIQDNSGKTAIHFAAEQDQRSILMNLIESGGDVNIQDVEGRTALHIASQMQHNAVVMLLLEKGANWDILDKHGKAAVTIIKKSSEETVQVQKIKCEKRKASKTYDEPRRKTFRTETNAASSRPVTRSMTKDITRPKKLK